MVLDFRFGHWKCPNREWGKGHFSKWKWSVMDIGQSTFIRPSSISNFRIFQTNKHCIVWLHLAKWTLLWVFRELCVICLSCFTRFPFFMPWQQIEVCYCCKCIFTASSCGRAMQSRLSLKCNLLLKPHIFENRLVPSSIPFGPEAKKQGRVLTNKWWGRFRSFLKKYTKCCTVHWHNIVCETKFMMQVFIRFEVPQCKCK